MLALVAASGACGFGNASNVGNVAEATEQPPVVALVNNDDGDVGKQVAKSLHGDGFTWEQADSEDSRADRFAVTVELPADLSTAVATLGSTQPQHTTITVRDQHTDPDLVARVERAVSRAISAQGIETALTAITAARTQLGNAALGAQILTAGIGQAKTGADQFTGGVDQLIGYLDIAKDGSAQLAAAIEQLRGAVGGATAQADQVASALSSTSVTLGQVSGGATQLDDGLGAVIDLLRPLPLPVDALARLEQLRGVARQVATQSGGLTDLMGNALDQNTDLGTLLTDVVAQMRSATGQLADGSNQLAAGIDQLATEGGSQLSGATSQLADGVTQLEQISKNLQEQVNKGIAAIPQRSAAEQASTATALADPVRIEVTGSGADFRVDMPTVLAIAFGATTVLFGAAWLRTRKVSVR